ncbi:uncharacterized protein MELLADRAFT_88961 [Melampsora larici-populina 98AG31]|uniref:RBR-type E3 ubiquitin transferase n=1 Tax=Melampsora larici-populina (strain 98AG31 / pathotype 3-4-7) TaxID=747676 RepID=F4R6F7_MELLP|nr:uncharacterized protein MELLADRAFT_88961 [Melampsora larici-populina 98AG31]EGG11869.1 hypothetical protein MELLADRAFT_88961 [Melampsora larici-populina 98AG31]
MSDDNSDIDMEYDSTGGYDDDDDVIDLDSNNLSSNEEEEGSDFNLVSSNPQSNKKLYEVDFKVLDEDELTFRQHEEIKHVAGIIGIEPKDAALVLRYFGWNKDLLMDKYMDSPEKVFTDAGIYQPHLQNSPDSSSKSTKRRTTRSTPAFVCQICYNDSPDQATVYLPTCPPLQSSSTTSSSKPTSVRHEFCEDCYAHYVIGKIREGEARTIECMETGCKQIVDENTIINLLKSIGQDHYEYTSLLERFQTLLNRTFVEDSASLKFCPAPNCVYAIECHVSKKSLDAVVPSVTCDCGYRFCFGCSLPDHQPCICPVVKMWHKKCADDSETANWISAHTKECAKCHSTIEKNGGCNHMTCKKCKYEFCRVCQGNDIYHYYNRFANHEQSLKLDKELHAKTERKMEEIQDFSNLSWIEVQFLERAVETLSVCRTTLKWTYAMAFYLEKNNFTALFEDNQRDLEQAVEELSGLLEEPIEPATIAALRQKVTDKTVYVHKRNEIMLEETAKDYQDGRVVWNTTFKL